MRDSTTETEQRTEGDRRQTEGIRQRRPSQMPTLMRSQIAVRTGLSQALLLVSVALLE